MKKIFSIITLLCIAFQMQAQSTMLVFKPTICTVSQEDTTYEIQTENATAFAFDFDNKVLHFVDNQTTWTENIITIYDTNWASGYKSISFVTPTGDYELWLFPDNKKILRPELLIERPLGGPVWSRQFQVLTKEERK